jgi:SAM-dependent methyltransferase
MDTIVSNKPSPDSHYSKLVYDWYHSIDKKDVVGYPTTIIDNKTQDIVTLIQRYTHKGLLIDIGSSDCQLAKDISSLLHMKPISVTIPHGHKTRKYQLEICQEIDKIKYDKCFVKQIRSFSEKVGVILFNHSLHHFGSKKAIQKALQEAYSLLEKGGVLLIRDHDSNNDDLYFLSLSEFEILYFCFLGRNKGTPGNWLISDYSKVLGRCLPGGC